MDIQGTIFYENSKKSDTMLRVQNCLDASVGQLAASNHQLQGNSKDAIMKVSPRLCLLLSGDGKLCVSLSLVCDSTSTSSVPQ